jgi:hypothetical protein
MPRRRRGATLCTCPVLLVCRAAAPSVALLGVLTLAPTAGAVGVPTTFPRTIAITDTKQHIVVGSFQTSFRAVGGTVRVRVRVSVASNDRNRVLVIAAGPCTGGLTTSPLCRPTARSRVNVPVGGTHWVRRFTIARPPRNHDAIRVTLTESAHAIPFRPENVGGGGGTAELLLNGGTWRYHQGTEWGIVTSPTEGITLSQIKFNSRTYAWSGTALGDVLVHTTIGYAGTTPRWDFQNTMKAGVPFGFRRTPSVPIYSQRTTPRALEFAAAFANEPQFKVTVPLPAWAGS